MKNLIIACDNLREEIEYIKNCTNSKAEVIYVDSKYHNNPANLNNEILKIIKMKEKSYDNILLTYGQCGNAIINLKSDYSNIIFPKVSDCISLYLGGDEKRSQIKDSERTYFFTKTYLENTNSLYNEIRILKNKYGEKEAIDMYRMVMQNYKYIRIIDTKAYNIEEIMDKVDELCYDLDLKKEVINADLSILRKAIIWDIDNQFVKKEKKSKILSEDFV